MRVKIPTLACCQLLLSWLNLNIFFGKEILYFLKKMKNFWPKINITKKNFCDWLFYKKWIIWLHGLYLLLKITDLITQSTKTVALNSHRKINDDPLRCPLLRQEAKNIAVKDLHNKGQL